MPERQRLDLSQKTIDRSPKTLSAVKSESGSDKFKFSKATAKKNALLTIFGRMELAIDEDCILIKELVHNIIWRGL